VREFVTSANVEACLQRQHQPLGLVGHTRCAAAWRTRRGGGVEQVRIGVDRPLDVSAGKCLLNAGAAGVAVPGAARLMGGHGKARARRRVLARA
jgi:hypothetical protein